MNIIQITTFYKVLIIAYNVFESSIIEERHFKHKSEAVEFAKISTDNSKIAVVITM